MDLDAYSTAHAAEWNRLAELAKRGRLEGREADELIDLYQRGATHLSAIKSTVGESVPGDHLGLSLSRARLKFTGTASNAIRQITLLFTLQLPAALYRVRWVTLAIAVVTALIALGFGVWVANDPRALASLGTPSQLKDFADNQFVGYYSASSEAEFAGQVWTNNALIAAQSIAFGIFGIWVPAMIIQNAQNVGVSGGIMASQDKLDQFFLFIAPHGQLELYSIFLAGGAGLLIFWSWVAPGGRTRLQALSEDGRAFFALVVGVILTLFVSGLIEGIVTRQDWPHPIKIGIGTVALLATLFYQWVIGRRAYRAGQTGDLEEFEAGAKRIVAG